MLSIDIWGRETMGTAAVTVFLHTYIHDRSIQGLVFVASIDRSREGEYPVRDGYRITHASQ
jgi:hypothetical protein